MFSSLVYTKINVSLFYTLPYERMHVIYVHFYKGIVNKHTVIDFGPLLVLPLTNLFSHVYARYVKIRLTLDL